MALSMMLGFCGIMLSNIYSSNAQNGVQGLTPTFITSNVFTVTWDEADFIESTGQFNVTVDGPESNLCDVLRDCDAEGDPPRCTFLNSDVFACGLFGGSGDILVPCTDITVTVARGGIQQSVSFNLAPDIKDGAIDPELTVDGNKATLSWVNSLTSNGGDISCATRALPKLQVSDGSEWLNGIIQDVILDANSTLQEWTLDYCQNGDLKAKVVYLTKTNDFPTFREFLDKDKQSFQGSGVTSVSTEVPEGSCSLNATWEVGCSEVDHYTVTCSGDETLNVTDTTFTCLGLTAGSHTVMVQAYLTGGEVIGEFKSTIQEIPPIAPDAPIVTSVETKASTLTVTWKKPTTPICLEVTGFSINASPDGTSVELNDPAANQTDLTDLKANTNYTVTVAATWSGGMGEAGSKAAKTAKEDDNGLSGGAIAGIVCGCFAGVALIGGGIFYGYKKNKF